MLMQKEPPTPNRDASSVSLFLSPVLESSKMVATLHPVDAVVGFVQHFQPISQRFHSHLATPSFYFRLRLSPQLLLNDRR